jgi:hypothetical protein
VLHDLTAVLKKSTAKGETAKVTITEPPSNEKFREQKRQKLKPSDDADKSTKKPAISATGVDAPQLRSKDEVPTRKFFAPLRSAEMEADHGDDADDSAVGQQQQALSSHADGPPPIELTSQVTLIKLQRQLKGLSKGHFELRSTRNETRVSRKNVQIFQRSALTSRAITSHTSPPIPNPRNL